MIKACLFDLDGTLLDTLTTISHYVNTSLNKFGFPSIETDKYKYLVGDGAKILIERALKEVGSFTEETFKKVFEYYNNQYNSDVKLYTEPYDGIVELLEELKKHNILTGVISNKPDYATKCVAKHFFGEKLLDTVRGQVEGVPVKPAPDGPIEVLKELGVAPQECIYVGDTGVDMKTGKNLGVYTIGVLWGFREYEELKTDGADLIVEKPFEIMDYVKKINI